METESKFAEQDPHDSSPQLINGGGDIRYWSDFGRLYYLPRSLQQVPDPPEWESTDPGWIQGHETFMRHNEVNMIVRYQLECIGMDMIGYRTYGWIRSSLC